MRGVTIIIACVVTMRYDTLSFPPSLLQVGEQLVCNCLISRHPLVCNLLLPVDIKIIRFCNEAVMSAII
jgi:hypothetical protein